MSHLALSHPGDADRLASDKNALVVLTETKAVRLHRSPTEFPHFPGLLAWAANE